MNKLFFASIIALLSATTATAQRYLTVTDETDLEETFDSSTEAGVIIRASEDLKLRNLSSNMDKDLQLAQKQYDDENGDVYYCLIFTPGRRILSVNFDGYYICDVNLDLDEGRMYRYNLYDPNISATNSYYQTNLRQGLSAFDDCDYHSARELFGRAARWSQVTESEREEAQQLISDCDSLLYHRKMGYNYADKLQYEDAIQHFNSAMRLNPRDSEIQDILSYCYSESAQMCNHYMQQGDEYMRLKEYATAVEMYQKVIDRNCDFSVEALTKRSEARQMLNKRNEYGSYFGIEIGHLKGFTTGTHRKRNGGYFSFRTNLETFDLISRKYELDKYPEVNLTFGWTLPIYTRQHGPFLGGWAHAGIGIASAAKYDFSDNLTNTYMVSSVWKSSNLPTESKDLTNAHLKEFITLWNDYDPADPIKMKDLLSPSFGFAVTPELGIAVKVWHFMARVTWQYNFSLNTDFDSVFGKSKLYFGIGYCW